MIKGATERYSGAKKIIYRTSILNRTINADMTLFCLGLELDKNLKIPKTIVQQIKKPTITFVSTEEKIM